MPDSSRSLTASFQRYPWLWVVPVLLLAFGLALSQAQRDALWYDEAYTHSYTGTGRLTDLNFSVWDTIANIAQHNPSWPPLYFILQNVWGNFAGNQLLSEHMLPLLLAMFSLAVFYRLAKALFDSFSAILATVLFATSALHLHFMHETRAYTLYLLLLGLMAWLYWLLLHHTKFPRWLNYAFPIVIGLSLYTHYVMGAFILGIGVYHVVGERLMQPKEKQRFRGRQWWQITHLWVNGCLLFSPWFVVLINHLGVEITRDRGLSLTELLQGTLYSFSNSLWFVFLPILVMSLGLLRQRVIRFLWIWLLSSVFVITLVNSFASFLFHPRHIIGLLLIVILLCVSVLRFSRPLALVVIGIWAGFGIFYAQSNDFIGSIPDQILPLPIETVDQMREVTERCVGEDDLVIFAIDPPNFSGISSVVLLYYFYDILGEFEQLSLLTQENDNTEHTTVDEIATILNSRMQPLLTSSSDVWLFASQATPLTEEITQLQHIMEDTGYQACMLSDVTQSTIWFYSHSLTACPTACGSAMP